TEATTARMISAPSSFRNGLLRPAGAMGAGPPNWPGAWPYGANPPGWNEDLAGWENPPQARCWPPCRGAGVGGPHCGCVTAATIASPRSVRDDPPRGATESRHAAGPGSPRPRFDGRLYSVLTSSELPAGRDLASGQGGRPARVIAMFL